MKSNLFVFDVVLLEKTEKAFKVQLGDTVLWLPRSHVRGRHKGGRSVVIVPYWLASKNGLLNKDGRGMHKFPHDVHTEEQIQLFYY